jgi:EAL domain-containing protein (putative c-di-GMP-specific phosphodiesterase class I)
MRAYWINEVQQALLDQRLVPHYQPIVHIASGKVTRYEALMRMHNTYGELVSPGEFLPIMEQTSHYPEMTRAIFKQSCIFFRYREENFSVNLSVDDLLRRETVDEIASMAQKYGVAQRLTVELVETENVHNYESALKALAELKQLGIKVAIDDFGSGFANFSYLSAFPADFVKIDGSLVSKVNEDEKTRNLVRVLIDYAHSEGMEVIAEFVSSAEILETISAMGCDYAQGYYFGAPTPGEKIEG